MKPIRGIRCLPQDACYDIMDSPVGELTMVASSQWLHSILWDVDFSDSRYATALRALPKSPRQSIIRNTKKQLRDYFNGKRTQFDLPLQLDGTPFQKQVWQQLLKIPYGKTISYGEQAQRLGDKKKARAVGMANGQNPIVIVIPCHRVIGSNGSLTGFGGGLDKKSLLLRLEQEN